MSSHDITNLTLQIGNLTLTVQQNQTQAPAPSAGAAAAAAVPETVAAELPGLAAPVAGRKNGKKPTAPSKRCYIIWGCRQAPDLVGLHYTEWASLEAQLPGKHLASSGARLRGFDDEAEALQEWNRRYPEVARPVFKA